MRVWHCKRHVVHCRRYVVHCRRHVCNCRRYVRAWSCVCLCAFLLTGRSSVILGGAGEGGVTAGGRHGEVIVHQVLGRLQDLKHTASEGEKEEGYRSAPGVRLW